VIRKLQRIGVLAGIFFLILAGSTGAATFHVRTDGGPAGECDGTSDTAYPGSGSGLSCAWAHPFWALDEWGAWKLESGDTLIIGPGSYMMGYGAPNTSGWCVSDWTWECHLPPLPSGKPGSPTRILGKGWDAGCAGAPELWGTERAYVLLDLSGTSHAEIACLDLTDHAACVEFHADPSAACKRDSYPHGAWASTGIFASDSSEVSLSHLDVHGLASAGIRAGRLTNWSLEDVRIAGNGWAGWDGDIYGDDTNQGTLSFTRFVVEWNGCGESYPGKAPLNCWSQTAGGYGDGFGTGATGGRWVFEDSLFRYNTSDGLDLLYVSGAGAKVEIRRTMAYGNAGNQVKTRGPTLIENSVMVGNCAFFHEKPFTHNVDNCRALGNALSLTVEKKNILRVVNSSLAGQGDCLISAECTNCDGSERLLLANNILQGHSEFLDPSDTTCYAYTEGLAPSFIEADYNVIYQGKMSSYPTGLHDIAADPIFVDARLDTFDGRLQALSPAIDSGLPVGSLGGLIPAVDITGQARPIGSGVDRGAYEYGAEPPLRLLAVSRSGLGTVISVPPGISCGDDCTEAYLPGTVVTLHPQPESGYVFAYWTGGCSGETATCSVTMDEDRVVQAFFVPVKSRQFRLGIAKVKKASGNGRVASGDGTINCGKDCSETFYPGAPVMLVATPDPGSVFTGWSAPCSGTGTCTIAMNRAYIIRVAFVGPSTLTVVKVSHKKGKGTVTSSPAGISCGTACRAHFLYDTPVTLTATPDPGSVFAGWAGVGVACPGPEPCTVLVNRNTVIRAIFREGTP
jgi:hypothetical protein